MLSKIGRHEALSSTLTVVTWTQREGDKPGQVSEIPGAVCDISEARPHSPKCKPYGIPTFEQSKEKTDPAMVAVSNGFTWIIDSKLKIQVKNATYI